MPFLSEFGAGGARLVLTGHVTVTEARALHAALLELWPMEGTITVDESALGGFDVTLLQLLLAFVRARRAAGRSVEVVRGPASARLEQLGLAA